LHLLLLAEAPADHLVAGRLDKSGADALPIPVALAIVGDKGAIALDIDVELLHSLQQLGVPGAIAGKFTVSRIAEKFVLMVAPIFISKNKAFEACCGT
jgi:hypothetical protein